MTAVSSSSQLGCQFLILEYYDGRYWITLARCLSIVRAVSCPVALSMEKQGRDSGSHSSTA
jgi:hypothetical protein